MFSKDYEFIFFAQHYNLNIIVFFNIIFVYLFKKTDSLLPSTCIKLFLLNDKCNLYFFHLTYFNNIS